MAFKARLDFLDREYHVLQCACFLNHDTDIPVIETMVNNHFIPLALTLMIKKSEERVRIMLD